MRWRLRPGVPAGFSSSLSNAILAASEAGIIVVASSGNEGVNVDVSPRFPACYQIDNIISVAASTRTDALWSSSNYGTTNVDLAAPGNQITSTFFLSDNFYLGPLSGSSFSAAYVSGACALLVGLTFGRSWWLLAPVALAWGFFVIADSAQFSVLVTESVPAHAVGTALTVQVSLGFLLTTLTIQLVPWIAARTGWAWAFAFLAIGPVLGILSIRRLRTVT